MKKVVADGPAQDLLLCVNGYNQRCKDVYFVFLVSSLTKITIPETFMCPHIGCLGVAGAAACTVQ